MMIKYFSYLLDKAYQSFDVESDPSTETEICQKLADYYTDKHIQNNEYLPDSIEQASSEIKSMGIQKLFLDKKNNFLHIHLSRPGILIGPKGSNISKLEKYLGLKIKIYETKSIEDMILNRIPYVEWD